MKIILADDSALVTAILEKVFQDDPEIDLIGIARNGSEAVSMTLSKRPDAVIMDINMPIMDGIEATSKIKSDTGIPVLVFSIDINETRATAAYDAGAVDVIKKPDISQLNDPVFTNYFKSLIKNLSSSRRPVMETNPAAVTDSHPEISFIVIGASTGGPKTVKKILDELPDSLPVPIAVVQHIEVGFDAGYAEWLNNSTGLTVELVREKTRPRPGHVYIASSSRHLVILNNSLDLDDGPRVQNQKPSADVLFSTASRNYGTSLLGVLLTGMGRDGAEGCVEILKNGGITIVQDAETSDIFGMPKAAIDLDAATFIRPLPEISGEIIRLCRSGRPG